MSEEWPLVTFALFAYNQEKYIREAVEAALAQDYPNLEIIISDDSSTDGTYACIQDVAGKYTGPHRIVTRVTNTNLGPFKHVLDVSSVARGKLLVLAAADDISKPYRVTRLFEQWQATGAWGLSSNYDTIDSAGKLLRENICTEELFSAEFDLRRYFLNTDNLGIVHGATSAYSAELFRWFDVNSSPRILSEDGMFSLVLGLLGKQVVHVEESLVRYRVHDSALTNVQADKALHGQELLAFIDKAAAYAASCKNRAVFFLDFAKNHPGVDRRKIDYKFVQSDVVTHDFRSRWMSTSLGQRFLYLLRNAPDWKWILPRMLGLRAYVAMKGFRAKHQSHGGQSLGRRDC